jgi:hypothetical protein
MSQLPPCSRGGTVRAPSAPIFALTSPLAWPPWAVGANGGLARIGRDQRGFTLVPFREQLRIRQAADQAGMDQARKAHAGNVARRRVEALDVPDRFLRQREVIGQEAAAILLGEEAVEAPQALLQRTDVEQVDDQEVARLRALDADRAGEEMHDRQVDVAHVVGGIIVLDEAPGPVIGLYDEIVARIDPGHDRNIGMPAVVNHVVVVSRLGKINLDQGLRHQKLSFLQAMAGF